MYRTMGNCIDILMYQVPMSDNYTLCEGYGICVKLCNRVSFKYQFMIYHHFAKKKNSDNVHEMFDNSLRPFTL